MIVIAFMDFYIEHTIKWNVIKQEFPFIPNQQISLGQWYCKLWYSCSSMADDEHKDILESRNIESSTKFVYGD